MHLGWIGKGIMKGFIFLPQVHGLIGASLVEWGAAVAEGRPVGETDWGQLEKDLNAAGDKSFRVSNDHLKH